MQTSYALDTAILIPAYQPDQKLSPYVDALLAARFGKIVVVDDGSGNGFKAVFDGLPDNPALHVIHYTPNRGKGMALRTGLCYLQDECPEIQYIVTADSDGQHTVEDTLRMAQRLHEDAEGVLLGSRDFSQPNVPKKSRYGNRLTSVVFCLLYGKWVGDTQTGLRGFSRALLPRMIAVKGDRYEYEMNVLIDCALAKVPIRSLTIATVYENNNEGSHFRPFRDGMRIYRVIFSGFFRFISSSLISFGVDYALFLLLNGLFKSYVPGLDFQFRFLVFQVLARVGLATALARIVSGLVNFYLNKRIVFEDQTSAKKTLPRYLCVFVLMLILSSVFTSNAHTLLGMRESRAKIIVDLVLFFVSYFLQRKWVFVRKPQLKGSESAKS
ncbi:MAG: glycosyltransferase [Clostridia bacterium]|nr:glycosyltransferase [Clostridia bacterium]